MTKCLFIPSLLICMFVTRTAHADVPEFDLENRLDHESLELRPAAVLLERPAPRIPLDNFQKTMAVVAVCSVVLSAISLGYRISQDQKNN